MCNEIWKPVPGYEGLYEVSNIGRVRSLKRNTTPGRILSQKISRYDSVSLFKDGKQNYCSVHRLVWSAFNGPIPDGAQVNHIDENPHNNVLSNLNLMSPKENTNWGSGIERRSSKRKKTVIQYTTSGEIVKEWDSVKSAAKAYGCYPGGIAQVCRGERHTAKGYVWKYKKVV